MRVLPGAGDVHLAVCALVVAASRAVEALAAPESAGTLDAPPPASPGAAAAAVRFGLPERPWAPRPGDGGAGPGPAGGGSLARPVSGGGACGGIINT